MNTSAPVLVPESTYQPDTDTSCDKIGDYASAWVEEAIQRFTDTLTDRFGVNRGDVEVISVIGHNDPHGGPAFYQSGMCVGTVKVGKFVINVGLFDYISTDNVAGVLQSTGMLTVRPLVPAQLSSA